MLNLTSKHPLASKGVWGGLLAVGAGVGGIWGYVVTPEDIAQVSTLAAGIVSSGAGILAVFGRVRATRKIG